MTRQSAASPGCRRTYSFTSNNELSGPDDFAQATEVQTNSAIVIDQIGVWAQSGSLTQDHGLRIRDITNGVDLFTGIILAGTGTLVDGFRYMDIVDIAVASGVTLACDVRQPQRRQYGSDGI
jgi:hypothetical protein